MVAAACFLLLWSGTFTVSADESGECGDGVSWSLSNGVLVISGSGAMDDYFEDSWAPWYDYRSQITSVEVQQGVTSIGTVAFFDMVSLKAVVLADSVERIGANAFQDCVELSSIKMSSSLKRIENSAFKKCMSLSSVVLPDGLEAIEDEAFYRCESLMSVRIPYSVYSLGDAVFGYCSSLVQAEANASIGMIPHWLFYECSSLINLSLNSAIDSVGESSFEGCESLSQISTDAIRDLSESISSQTGTSVTVKDHIELDELTSKIETEEVSKDVIENAGSVVQGTVDKTDDEIKVSIDAIIQDESGFQTVMDQVLNYHDKNQGYHQEKPLDVDLNLQNQNRIPKEVLNTFAGKDIQLNIESSAGNVSIDCKNLKDRLYSDLELGYELSIVKDADESMSAVLNGSAGYLLRFKGNVDYPIAVKMLVGYMNQTASLYQKKGNEWTFIQSVHIDSSGFVTFYLDGYDVYTEYLIGINTNDAYRNVLLSEEEVEQYGGLMDEFGNKYEITGVESRWGITLGQFTLIIAAVMIALVSLIGVVMYVLYKRNQMLENKKGYRKKIKNEN